MTDADNRAPIKRYYELVDRGERDGLVSQRRSYFFVPAI